MVFRASRAAPVGSGETFQEVQRRDESWTVEAFIERLGFPRHVRLRSAATGREMTLAASVLADATRFRRFSVPNTSEGE